MVYIVTLVRFSVRHDKSSTRLKMSVLSGLSKSDFKTASDGLLELSEERLRSIMHTEPITDVYHVEQTPFARSATLP